jgi:hypothetical protein
MDSSLAQLLEDEWYLVRHSGETPEIALHSALYFLTRAKDGPHAVLSSEQVDMLLGAATTRFAEIILRDLLHANHGKTMYRGINRSMINYKRFSTFCQRQKIDPECVRYQTAEALRDFLSLECEEVSRGKRATIVHCTYAELSEFARQLHVDLVAECPDLAVLCLSP